MNKINIIKSYYKHEIKIKDNISELFIYENNNNNYTLYFYVPNNHIYNPPYSFSKIKQINPNYIIYNCINMNLESLTKIKNYDYIQINILNYFLSYNYDLELDSYLKIKK